MLFEGNQTILNLMQQGSQMLNLTILRQCLALVLPQLKSSTKKFRVHMGSFLGLQPQVKIFPIFRPAYFLSNISFHVCLHLKGTCSNKKNSLLSTLPLWYKWEDIYIYVVVNFLSQVIFILLLF